MITTQDIVKISSYFTVIHHTPGRLRTKIDKSIVNDIKNISLQDITTLPNQVDGLTSIKINKITATATILYDSSVFAPKIWNDLITGVNLEEVLNILNELQHKLKEV